MKCHSYIDLDKIQVWTNKEEKVGPSIQFEIEKAIKETNIPPSLPNRLDWGCYKPSYIESILLMNMSHWYITFIVC